MSANDVGARTILIPPEVLGQADYAIAGGEHPTLTDEQRCPASTAGNPKRQQIPKCKRLSARLRSLILPCLFRSILDVDYNRPTVANTVPFQCVNRATATGTCLPID
jgi:hypothetical protein